MSRRIRELWSKKSPKPFRSARPEFESLESREVPTVTFHGGAVLQNVEVQGVYYGSDWNTPAYSGQKAQLDNFLQYVVQSGYTSVMLANAYGTGAGTASPGQTYGAALNKSAFLTDSAIRSTLQSCISAGALQQPDANRLYVVFVEDNVVVDGSAVPGVGGTSQNKFLGYHTAFAGTDQWGNARDIRYAIIAYPGGSAGNAAMSWLTSTNDMTQVTSHEMAEAITDPDVNYKTAGWYDSVSGENGDIANSQTVYLNGYAVQRIADRNDQPMTPYSVGPERAVQFVLQTGGYLYEHSASGSTLVSSGVASVSDQGIDNLGRAMVDYVTTAGNAYEYHDRGTWQFLTSGVAQAKAGQGASYVVQTNGNLWEYHDASWAGPASWTYLYNGSIRAIDAGTDKYGVNAVDVLFTSGYAYLRSDTDGWHFLMSNVRQVAGGQQGLVALLDNSGYVWSYNEWSGTPTFLTSGARQVTTGYDAWGHLTIGVVFTDASAWIYTPSYNSWSFLTGGVSAMSKDNLGQVTVLFGGTDTSFFDLGGKHPLFSSGGVAVA